MMSLLNDDVGAVATKDEEIVARRTARDNREAPVFEPGLFSRNEAERVGGRRRAAFPYRE
jgi:hypothetical protein